MSNNVASSLPILVQDAKQPSNFTRPVANFHPSIWGDYFLSSVPSSEEGDSCIKQTHELLKEKVREMLVSPIDNNISFKLNFIDSVQRLGVSYHFEHEIDGALQKIHDISIKDNNIITHDDDICHVALLFRLLRQQGYRISSDVFYKFKDRTGNFSERVANDIQGMLSLYESSQLRFHGEDILEEAYNFTLIQLTKFITTQSSPIAAQVKHSLRQSLRKGLPRLEATYYMSFYQEDPSHDQNLLTFAKLDFNLLQELHQKEVCNITKWWITDINISTKFPFARDRIVECYFWILGVYFEPKFSLLRRITTKVMALCSIIDDMYDAYGTIDELELFTYAIERWNICCLVDLPKYMKLCYMEILNVFEEMEQEMTKQGKIYCIKYAKKEMKRLIQAHMAEARWLHHCNHTPTIEEYMQVRTVTSGYSILYTVSFIGMEDTTEEVLIWLTRNPKIVAASTIICRLMDDIAGNEFEREREHIDSSIECYIKQHKISRKDAIEELCKMVESAWKDINEACLTPTQIPMTFLMRIVNYVRVIDVLYKDEDIYTHAGGKMKEYIEALLVNKLSF